MKKLFFAICFIAVSVCVFRTHAASTPVSSMVDATAKNRPITPSPKVVQERQKLLNMTQEEMEEYLKNRLKKAVKTNMGEDDNGGMNGDGTISVQKSPEALAREAEAKKSTFQKIYDNAMNRITDRDEEEPQAQYYTEEQSAQDEWIYQQQMALEHQEKARQHAASISDQQAWLEAGVDTINVALPPNDENILVPAKEHIPYLFDRIEILPDGLIKIDETIVAVANGDRLKKGIVKTFPKYVVTREGKKQKVDFSLLRVLINDSPAEYKVRETPQKIVIEPAQNMDFAPGVYRYDFQYVFDNHILQYDEFDEFFYDITGGVWNLVIARAGAALVLPPNTQTLGQTAVSGYPNSWTPQAIRISREADNVLGFVSLAPLFVGQGMQLIVSIPKGAISNVSAGKKFVRFILENGDVLFSLAGFLAIALSYFLSWRYIRKNKGNKLSNLRQDAPLMRYLLKGKTDNVSFGAFLLNLFRKNVIDIEENDGNILLVKKTDDTKSLTKQEKKALSYLFTNNESVLNVNHHTALKVKRAMSILQNDIAKKMKLINLKLNSGYLFFSIGMLLLAELSIAALSFDIVYNFGFMLGVTVSFAFYTFILFKKFKSKAKAWAAKIPAAIFLAFSWFILCAVVSPLTSFILLATVFTIIAFSKLYAKRDGLLKSSIIDVENYKKYLTDNAENIGMSRDFLLVQPAIFALDLGNLFKPKESIKDFYKLKIVDNLMAKL